jgi:hypothetical protein
MSAADVAFLLGPIGALLVVPAASLLVLAGRRPKWAMWAVVALAPIATVTWLVYWLSWGRAFEYADAYQSVPDSVQGVGDAAMGTCAAAVLALTLVGITSFLSARPSAGDGISRRLTA